jgi:hypothetical protein
VNCIPITDRMTIVDEHKEKELDKMRHILEINSRRRREQKDRFNIREVIFKYIFYIARGERDVISEYVQRIAKKAIHIQL